MQQSRGEGDVIKAMMCRRGRLEKSGDTQSWWDQAVARALSCWLRRWQVGSTDAHVHLSAGEGKSSTRTTSLAEEDRAGLEDAVGSQPLLRSGEVSRN